MCLPGAVCGRLDDLQVRCRSARLAPTNAGDLLRSSSGTTDRPRRESNAEIATSHGCGTRDDTGTARFLDGRRLGISESRADVPHRSSVWTMSALAAGVTTVVMEKFDAEGAPRHHRGATTGARAIVGHVVGC